MQHTAFWRCGSVVVAMVLVALSAGCQGSGPLPRDPDSSASSSSERPPASRTEPQPTPAAPGMATATTPVDVGKLALPVSGQGPDPWETLLELPYGTSNELLGVSPGHDGIVGPEYGAQAPDGTWWLLDSARARIAHYDGAGHYLGATELTPDQLADGRYFQWQHLRALADGTLVATSFSDERTNLLTIADNSATAAAVSDRLITVIGDDGQSLYGVTSHKGFVRIDPSEAEVSTTDWMRTPGGNRYAVGMSGHHLELRLPDFDDPVHHRWEVVSAVDDEAVRPVLELATDIDGRLHLLLYGTSEATPSVQLSAYVRLGVDGSVEVMQPTPHLFSDADPGSASHLGIRPGGLNPWLMLVDKDAVRILRLP